MTYGYIRVSSKEQNEDRQIIALKEYNIPKNNIYTDKQSGKDFNRKSYKRLIQKLQENDLVVVKSIDRLGRNYKEIIEQWKIVTEVKKADILVIDMPILDTRRGKDLMGTFLSDIVLQVLSFVAENERANIRLRQAEGIAAAKERGVKFGRPKVYKAENYINTYNKFKNGEITQKQAMKEMGVSQVTYYRIVNEIKNMNKN